MPKHSLIFLIAFVLIFFHKAFLGLYPLPADIITGGYFPWVEYKWGAAVGVPVRNPLLTDAVSITYPFKFYLSESLKEGQLPLWNDRIFGGYPLIGSSMAAIFFPTNLLYLILPTIQAWTIQVISQIIIALIGMYLLAKQLKLSGSSSLLAAIAYSFGGFSMIWLEWNNQTLTASLTPWLILLVDKFLTEKRLILGVGVSVVLTLQILAGYTPVLIFSLLITMVWFLSRSAEWKAGSYLLLFLALGSLLSSVYLLPAVELYLNSQRPYEVINPAEVFLPWEYLVTLFSHDFFGNPAAGNFFGPGNYLNTAIYSGLVTLVLAVPAVLLHPKPYLVRPLVAIFLLSLLIMTPNPLSRILYDLGVWGGPSMTMNRATFLTNFSLALLAGIGLEELTRAHLKKIVLSTTGITGILLGLIIFSYLGNLNVSLRNSLLPLGISLGILLTSLIWWRVAQLPRTLIQFILITLILVDLFYYGWKFNPFTPEKYLYPKTPVIEFLQAHPGARFASELDLIPPNMWIPLGLSSISGYDSYYPLEIGRLIAVNNSGNTSSTPQTKHAVLTRFNSQILDQASTRYILSLKRGERGEVRENGMINPALNSPKFKPVFENKSVVILENLQALPRAYLNSNPEVPLNLERTTNSRYQVIVSLALEDKLVITNTYYPGWRAYLNNQEIKIEPFNGAFQSVNLPPGKHQVLLAYQPASLTYGGAISLVTLLMLFSLYLYLRQHHKLIV